MVTLHVAGTRLAQKTKSIPLNKPFLVIMALLYLVAMHFVMKNPGGSGLDLTFNHPTWIMISLAIAMGLVQTAKTRAFHYSKLTIGLFISCLLMSLPLLYSDSNVVESSSRIIGLWAGLLFFSTLQQFQFSNKHRQRLLWFVVLATLVEAIIGYIQYFLLEPGNVFGYDTLANRPYGIFQQPNVMASFLATGLVLSGYLLARHPKKYHKTISAVALLYLTPAILTPLLIVLGSRTGWLGAALGVVCILPYVFKFAGKKRFWGWCISIVVGLLLGFVATQSSGKSEFIVAKADLESPRRYTLPQTLDMFIEKPISGYGYGQFEPAYILYTARQHQLNNSYPAGLPSMDHPHNETLLWAVEGGIVPIIGLLLAATLVLSHISSANKGTRLAMFALFLPILLHTQLEYPFYHSAIHWFTFILLIFWVDQRTSMSKVFNISLFTKIGLKVSAPILPFVTAIYMLTALHSNYVLMQYETAKVKNPDVLSQVSNVHAWQNRYDWNIYVTYLHLGLSRKDPALIQPYIDWSLDLIQRQPRPSLYTNLIIAYQGLGDSSKAEQIRAEAQFLFPKQDFTLVNYRPKDQAISNAASNTEQ